MKEKREVNEKWIRRIYLCALLISIVIIFWNFLSREQYFLFRDAGSDTYDQYYPYYANCVMRIKEGTFNIWNWDYGPGTSILNNVSQTLDPFAIFVISGGVLLGVGKVKYLLLAAHILKIIVASLLCRYFLKICGFSEAAACIGGYLYGFNGYLMLWGQHYMLGTGCVYLMLVFICLEKLIRRRRWKDGVLLALAVALSLFYNYYSSYMILLFAAIYFLCRIMKPGEFENFKSRIYLMAKCLLSVITGILLSGAVLLPIMKYLTVSSSRLDADASSRISLFFEKLFSFPSNEIFFETFSRLLSNNLIYINEVSVKGWQNYYEMPNVCFTVLIYVMIGQFIAYLWKRRKNRKEFIYYIIMMVLAVLVLLNPGMAMAFNGFVYPVWRYTFIIFPVAAMLVAFVWDKCIASGEISVPGILGGLAVSAVILGKSYQLAAWDLKRYSKIYFLLIVVAACILILMRWRKESGKLSRIGMGCLVVIMAGSSMLDAYITNNKRYTYGKEFEVQGFADNEVVNDTTNALKYIRSIDSSFYRVDKTYVEATIWGDSLLNRYSSMTYYNSTMNRNLADYYMKIYPNAGNNDRVNIFSLKNREDVEAVSLMNMKYLLSKEPIENKWFEYAGQTGSTLIYKNKRTDSVAKWYTKTIDKESWENLKKKERIKCLEDTLITEKKDNHYRKESNGNTEIGTFALKSDVELSGSVAVTEEGILMLAIPDQQGWDIYVDGKKTEAINADYGFLGIELKEGNHKIEAKYHIPYWKEGILVSCIGLLFLCGMLFFMRKSQHIEQQREK